MNQNSFQKNGLLNVGGQNRNNNQNIYNQFGSRNIQDIRDDLWKAKSSGSSFKPEESNMPKNDIKHDDVKKRIENLQNLNRWKG